MQVSVIKDDNMVIVDGLGKEIDLSFLPDNFHAMQFDGNNVFVEGKDIDSSNQFTDLTKWEFWNQIDSKYKAAPDPTVEDEEAEEQLQNMPPTAEELMMLWRQQRDFLLQESDIYVLQKVELGQTVDSKVVEYRKALRDLPQKVEGGSLPKPTWANDEVVFNNWPTKPF